LFEFLRELGVFEVRLLKTHRKGAKISKVLYGKGHGACTCARSADRFERFTMQAFGFAGGY
jgi:hypothetical protein